MKRLFCFCLGFIFTLSYAQDGSPDLSFGNNGYIIYEPSGEEHFIQGAIETEDENILTVVNTYNGSYIYRVFAFNQEGLPLNEFGIDGVLELTGPFNYYNGIIKLNGGGFLLHGMETNHFIVSKHFDDGSLDNSFGNTGYLYPFLNGGSGNRIMTDTENNIIVAGTQMLSGVPQVVLKRFLTNGIEDQTFGSNGQVFFAINGAANLIVRSLIIKGDFYYSELNYNDSNQEYKSIIRFDSDGTIDTSFGTNGLLQIPIESEFFTNFNIFDNGTILIGGFYWDNNLEILIRKTIKINTQGEILQNFGNNGQINGYSGGYIQENQRFISDGSDIDFEGGMTHYFRRYFSNGSIDNSFQFGSNYPDVIGTSVMLHLQSGKFMLISSDIWYNWPDIKISLQRFNNDPLSVSDIEKSYVTVYPNPSSSIFQIQNATLLYNSPFEIFDSLGKKVLSGYFSENFHSIDLSNVESGIYFLKITDNSQTVKLLKK